MNTIVWTLSAAGLPGALRRCACCGAMRSFQPSGMFRVNANGRRLDIWLIYKCEVCQKTWNMEVASRVSPGDIAPDTYRRYLHNDPREVARCACDPVLWQRNQMRPDEAGREYALHGEDIRLTNLQEAVSVEIRASLPVRARLDKLVCAKLGISRETYKRMQRAGTLRVEMDALRSGGGARLAISPEIRYDGIRS